MSLSKHLKECMSSLKNLDKNVIYSSMFNWADKGPCQERTATIRPRAQLRLPCRLVSPMVQIPAVLKDYIAAGFPEKYSGLNQVTLDSFHTVGSSLPPIMQLFEIKNPRYGVDMDLLLSYTRRIGALYLEAMKEDHKPRRETHQKLVDWLTKCDINHTTMSEGLEDIEPTLIEDPTGFFQLVTRLRAVATRLNGQGEGYTRSEGGANGSVIIMLDEHDSASIDIYHSGIKARMKIGSQVSYICFSDRDEVSVCPTTFVDYAATRDEIDCNLSVIQASRECAHFRPLIRFLKGMSTKTRDHDAIVDLMKASESFMAMTADFKHSPRNSVASYVDVIQAMIKPSEKIQKIGITVSDVFDCVFSPLDSFSAVMRLKAEASPALRLAMAIRDLTPVQCLEASSLHKMSFYAVIEEVPGLDKLFKRTHTRRDTCPRHIRLLRCFFNREVITEYANRHKKLPSVLTDREDLEKADVLPQLGPVNWRSVASKYSELSRELQQNGKLSKTNNTLDWWYDLRPYNCETKADSGSPIERAKDKRSATTKGTYSTCDTEKELEAIIKSENFKPIPVIGNDQIQLKAQKIEIIQQGSRTYDDVITAVFKLKNGEQKKEGRFFGMFTTPGKQGLSEKMAMAEHILDYFDGNLMTPSDERRKKMIHWAAQSLLDDETYSILMDIEGHNQSMQRDNTADLLESIGLCYGEFGWNELADLFGSLNFFYTMTYEDYAVISNGQFGGTEGWFNPVWTMHTHIVMSLVRELTAIVMPVNLTYSDDVAATVKARMDDPSTLELVLETFRVHFEKFGMTLKPSQTVVSKGRFTMLRQHYIGGIRADASLKRMLSTSSIHGQSFHCDELEASGISSSVSSALELSNVVYTPTLLKWYRLSHLLLRPFLTVMSNKVDDSIMNEDHFTLRTVALYTSCFEYGTESRDVWACQELMKVAKAGPEDTIAARLEGVFKRLSSAKLSTDHVATFKASLTYCIEEDDGLKLLFMLRCVLPADLGGCSVQLLEPSILTGVRDTVGRLFGSLHTMFKPEERLHSLLRRCLEFGLGGLGNYYPPTEDVKKHPDDYLKLDWNKSRPFFKIDYKETLLTTQEWPNAQRVRTADEIISSALLAHLKRICVNPDLKLLLEQNEHRVEYKQALVDELRDRFYGKIASFFDGCSVFMIVDKILSKVENTSSLITKVKNFRPMCKQLSSVGIHGFKKILLKPTFTFGKITRLTNMQCYLFARRSSMFPKVNFVGLIEPEADQLLVEKPAATDKGNDPNWFIHTVRSPNTVYVGGIKANRAPVYGSEALYKGEIKDSTDSFTHIRECYMIKVISVAKWVIYRSDPKKYWDRIRHPNNISNCADLTLATLGYQPFSNYVENVPLLSRSEVAHRIPLLDAKTKAVCRSLPAVTTNFSAIYNQTFVTAMDLTDSNLHFDYFKMRVITAQSVRLALGLNHRMNLRHELLANPLVCDARLDFVIERSERRKCSRASASVLEHLEIPPSKIRWLCGSIETLLTKGYKAVRDIERDWNDETEDDITFIAMLIHKHYKHLVRLNLWEANVWWGLSAWAPFRHEYQEYLPKDDGEFRGMVTESIYNRAKATVQGLKQDARMTLSETARVRLIDAYRQHLAPDRLDSEETLERLEEVVKEMRTFRGTAAEKVQATEGFLDELGIMGENLLESVLGETILEVCLVCGEDQGKIVVDRVTTTLNFEAISESVTALRSYDSKVVFLMAILKRDLGMEGLQDLFTTLMDTVEALAQEIGGPITIDEAECVDPKSSDPGPAKDVPVVVDQLIPMEIYEIKSISVEDISMLEKALRVREDCIRIHGSPWVADCPLASDIYQTALSLIRALCRVNILYEGMKVIDACSGRGEFRLAFKSYNINCLSLSRKDDYSMSHHAEGIEFVEAYDLTADALPTRLQNEVLDCGEGESIVFLDISHLGKQTGKLVDRILDLLNLGAHVVVRFNAVRSNLETLITSVQRHKGMCKIAIGGTNLQQLPTTYLYLSHLGPKAKDLKGDGFSTQLVTRLARDVLLLQREGPKTLNTDGPRNCSVIHEMGGISRIELTIWKRIESLTDFTMKKALRKLCVMRKRLDYIPILGCHREELIKRPADRAPPVLTKAGGFGEFFEELMIVPDKEDRAAFSEVWNSEQHYVLVVAGCTRRDLEYILKHHPSKTWRSMASAMLSISLTERENPAETPTDFVDRVWRENTRTGSYANLRSRRMVDALLLLCWDVLANSPAQYRVVLSIAYKGGILSRSELHDLCYYRKMLSGIYPVVWDFFRSDVHRRAFGRKLVESALSKFVRPTVYNTKARTTILCNPDLTSEAQNTREPDSKLLNQRFVEMLSAGTLATSLMEGTLQIDCLGKIYRDPNKPVVDLSVTYDGNDAFKVNKVKAVVALQDAEVTAWGRAFDQLKSQVAKWPDESEKHWLDRVRDLASYAAYSGGGDYESDLD